MHPMQRLMSINMAFWDGMALSLRSEWRNLCQEEFFGEPLLHLGADLEQQPLDRKAAILCQCRCGRQLRQHLADANHTVLHPCGNNRPLQQVLAVDGLLRSLDSAQP